MKQIILNAIIQSKKIKKQLGLPDQKLLLIAICLINFYYCLIVWN